MKLKSLTLATASAALALAPVAAQAASSDRSAAPNAQSSELGRQGTIGPALIVIALAAIGMGILLISDDDDDSPASA